MNMVEKLQIDGDNVSFTIALVSLQDENKSQFFLTSLTGKVKCIFLCQYLYMYSCVYACLVVNTYYHPFAIFLVGGIYDPLQEWGMELRVAAGGFSNNVIGIMGPP